MALYLRNPTRLLASQQRSLFFSTLSPSSSPSPPPPPPPPFPSFKEVKSAIESTSDPLKLAQIFESTSAFAHFRRHRPLFHLSVRKLARSHRLDLVDRILTLTLTTSPPNQLNSEGFWLRIVMLYSEAGMVDRANEAFQQMGCERTEKSLCAILSVHIDNKIYDKVHEIFDSVPQKIGVSPGVKSYNLLLQAFCEEKKISEATELLEKMESEAKVEPDINSYNVILKAYLENGGNNLFDRLVKKIQEKGLELNLSTYNYRILRWCKSKECVRANKLLDEMDSKGVKPNSASYNCIVSGFCKVGDLESARKILEKMVSDGYASPPSFAYYTLMRHMVAEGEFDSALAMCKEIIRRKWVPPFEAMEGLVHGLVKMSKGREAKEVVEKMKSRLKGDAVDSWGKIEAALPL